MARKKDPMAPEVAISSDREGVVAHLAALQVRSADGRLHPEAVVADAEDPSSPLHGLFEWDDLVAAQAHRIPF